MRLQSVRESLLSVMVTPMPRALVKILIVVVALTLGACANMPGREPLQVTVADIESIPGEDLEVRMMVKLRVQNPNDAPVEYNGVYLKLEVLDKTFATGVSNEHGTIPRFGESIVSVPVTVSMLRMGLYALSMLSSGTPVDKVKYKMTGDLSGPVFGSNKFQTQGELTLPGATPGTSQ
jgi:LEA14-like dessication related protein